MRQTNWNKSRVQVDSCDTLSMGFPATLTLKVQGKRKAYQKPRLESINPTWSMRMESFKSSKSWNGKHVYQLMMQNRKIVCSSHRYRFVFTWIRQQTFNMQAKQWNAVTASHLNYQTSAWAAVCQSLSLKLLSQIVQILTFLTSKTSQKS